MVLSCLVFGGSRFVAQPNGKMSCWGTSELHVASRIWHSSWQEQNVETLLRGCWDVPVLMFLQSLFHRIVITIVFTLFESMAGLKNWKVR